MSVGMLPPTGVYVKACAVLQAMYYVQCLSDNFDAYNYVWIDGCVYVMNKIYGKWRGIEWAWDRERKTTTTSSKQMFALYWLLANTRQALFLF